MSLVTELERAIKEYEEGDKDALLINRDRYVESVRYLIGKGFLVLAYIIENATVIDEHILLFTCDISNICKLLSMSRPTVVKAIKALEEGEFLIKKSRNVWIINKDILFYDENPDKYMLDDYIE